jgi:threonine/homoserine/homoserine lactone efflux protein
MHLIPLLLIAFVIFLVALGIALAIAASPLLAAIVFVIAFGGFLVWRGKKRAESERRQEDSGVPTTQEAAADPAEDSGAALVGTRPQRGPTKP